MTTLASCFPPNPKVMLTADNVDGVANQLLVHGQDVPSWFEQGTTANPWIITSTPSITLKTRRPILKTSNLETTLRFTGMYSLLTKKSSAASLGFLHAPGVFDVFVVLRKLETSINNTGTQRIIMGASDSGANGLRIAMADASLGQEGMVRVVLGSGGFTTVLLSSTEIVVPVGTPYKLLVRCDGQRLSVSHDFINFDSIALAGPVGSAGPAANDYSVGGAIPMQDTPNCLGAEMFAMGIYDTNNDTPTLLGVDQALQVVLGGGV